MSVVCSCCMSSLVAFYDSRIKTLNYIFFKKFVSNSLTELVFSPTSLSVKTEWAEPAKVNSNLSRFH